MKVSSPAHFERSPNMFMEIKNYIKHNPFQVTEACKNITKLLAGNNANSITNIQKAYKIIYGNHKTDFQLLSALEYVFSKIIHNNYSLEQIFTELGIENIPDQHPTINAQIKTTHKQIKNTIKKS